MQRNILIWVMIMNSCIDIKKYRSKMGAYIVILFLKSGLVLSIPYCYLLFLNEIITAHRFEYIWMILLLYVYIYMGKAFLTVLAQKIYNKIFPVMILETKKIVLEKYDSLDLEFVSKYTAGELKLCLHKDTENTVLYYAKRLEMLILLTSILVTTGILLYLNWILAIISFALLPLSFWITRYIKGKSNIEFERERQILGEYNDFMIHNMFFWKEVKTNCQEEMQQKQFESFWREKGDAFLKSHMCWFMNRTFLAFKDIFLTKMGLYLLGGVLVILGKGTVPVLLTFMEYYADYANRLLEAVDIYMKRGEQEQSMKRVQTILELPIVKRSNVLNSFDQLDFQKVSFVYNENAVAVIHNFSMKIKNGDCVAIVGESGSGKSTLIKIMAGCLTPTTGEILWNGQSMNQIERKSIYKKVGFLMQESNLFNLSIRDNLLLGKSDATSEELVEACRKANILEFIQELPEKFDTFIGENGIRLSGGQKQRLLIARIFLQNPEVIVFDEATSALDYKNESDILNLLLDNAQGKTFIMVTHRRSSLDRCNYVINIMRN